MPDAKTTTLNVKVYPIAEPKGSVVAFASVTIGGMFAVNNIRVVNSEKGAFVAMPQIKDAKGEYRDICFPVTAELRKQFNDMILGAYAAEREKAAPQKESTVEKLREAQTEKPREAKHEPEKAKDEPVKSKKKTATKKSHSEL